MPRKLGYNISYKYDNGGIRTEKTVNGVTTNFVTNGIQVLAQKSGDEIIVWQIDANGNNVGFNHNGEQYFYIKNAQGDVVGITDASGNLKAQYTYDSWGKIISINDNSSVNIGEINPIRYRGYYYDTETGLYYLNARYYDPETGRFLNTDDTEILFEEDNKALEYNLFTYCLNNPVNNVDLNGKDAVWLQAEYDVALQGHTGLLLQDSNGVWYHFYWGNSGSGTSGKKGVGSQKSVLEKLDHYMDVKELNEKKYYGGTYTGSIYFQGDFSKSIDFVNKNIGTNYNLITKNCMQMSASALILGEFSNNTQSNRQKLASAILKVTPNQAYDLLK